MKLLQEEDSESNPQIRRTNQLIEVHRKREEVFSNTQLFQDKMKMMFDKRTKPADFHIGDLVLKWNAHFEDKGKNGNLFYLWVNPYKKFSFKGKNAYLLESSDNELTVGGPVNGRFLKPYFQ